MTLVTSQDMTDPGIQMAADAQRSLGKTQIHQLFRELAIELGLPPGCSAAGPEVFRRRSWWITEALDRGNREVMRQLRLEAYFALTLPRSGDRIPIRVTGI